MVIISFKKIFHISSRLRYVDYVLLMTYNYHGANWENVTGHHSALLPHRLDKDADRQHNFVC